MHSHRKCSGLDDLRMHVNACKCKPNTRDSNVSQTTEGHKTIKHRHITSQRTVVYLLRKTTQSIKIAASLLSAHLIKSRCLTNRRFC